MRHWLASLVLLAWLSPAEGAEALKRYDADGRPQYEAIFDGDRLVEEVEYRYDARGRLVEKKTTHDGLVSRERFQYLRSGRLAREEVWSGTRLLLRRTWLYRLGRVASITEETPLGRRRVTTYVHDNLGRLLRLETRDEHDRLRSSELSRHDPASPPLALQLEAGARFRSDLPAADLALGVDLSRDPHAPGYEREPLELRLSVDYWYTAAGDAPDNTLLTARADVGFRLAGALELAFTGRFLRSPGNNLPIDLELAPVMVRAGFHPIPPLLLHFGAGPLWHHRSGEQFLEAGQACNGVVRNVSGPCVSPVSRTRAAIDTAFVYRFDPIRLAGWIDVRPALTRLGTETQRPITLRTGMELELALSERFSLRQTLEWTRDRTLAEVGRCSPPETSLCEGWMLTTAATLAVRLDVVK